MKTWIVLLAVLLAACGAHKEEEEGETHSTATADESSVAMTPATAGRNGITAIALQAAGGDTSASIGSATVVDIGDLVSAVSQRGAAALQREEAEARARVSRAELQRLRMLNADDHNVSDRVVQEAAAAAAADEAAIRSGAMAARAVEESARQRWGAVLVQGMMHGAPWAQRLAARDLVLVEAAFSDATAPPRSIVLAGADGSSVSATYLAASPHVDPRLQKPAHDYLAPAAQLPAGLVTTIRASRPTGGVLVPAAAVVWLGDQSLVFVEEGPGRYVQHPVDAGHAIPGGYLDGSLQPGQRVVVAGAQQLLSEQHKPEAE